MRATRSRVLARAGGSPLPAVESELARALAGLDRRAFLLALALAAAAGILPSACRRAPAGPADAASLRALSARGAAVLRAAAARIVGPGGAALVASGAVDPARHADRLLAGAPELLRALGPALLALEFGIPPLLAKWRPFSALSGPEQDAILAELAGSRLAVKRRIFAGIRAIALVGFYAAPEARALLAYPHGAPEPAVTIEDAMRDLAGEGSGD